MASTFHLNQRLSYSGELCTVRYVGEIEGATGDWLGVEWDDALRGKHSGTHEYKQYFTCKITGAGSFIRPTRTPDKAVSFLQGVKSKYAAAPESHGGGHPTISLSISKVVEEVGFEKIVEKLAKLKELKIVLVDGWSIDRAGAVEEIKETCPNIEELDLSRNRFEKLQDVADICAALPKLKALRISGNRFASVDVASAEPFSNIKTLDINNVLLEWDEFARVLALFPSARRITAHHNSFSSLPTNPFPPHASSVDLSNNLFREISSVASLSSLASLASLSLSHNFISSLSTATVFPSITRLDISYNALNSTQQVDDIVSPFPSLTNLHISHNPMGALSLEDLHMQIIARLPTRVTVLNHSSISKRERENAELWYISQIAKEIVADGEAVALAKHRRWKELCELHGEPDMKSMREVKREDLMAAEMVIVRVCWKEKETVKRVPKTLPVSTLRRIVAKWAGVGVLRCRMKWIPEVVGEVAEENAMGDFTDTRALGIVLEEKRGRLEVEEVDEGA